jgi:serine/threonine-protein kinase
MRLLVFSAAVAICTLAFGSTAFAGDPPKEPPQRDAPKGDAAVAQALFYEARQLMKDYKFAVACPKLEESLKLDYGIGTEFNLADCNEKLGKVATAWSGFLSVAMAARSSHQADREKVAKDRAKALEPRLPKLTIEVPATANPQIEVKRDGAVVGGATWNMPVPVDPGSHEVTATAPDKLPWKTTVDVAEGKQAKVTVPDKLQNAPVAQAPAPAPVPIAAPPDQASPTTTAFPEPIIENRGGAQRTGGWILAGAGVASLAVGGAFGIDSIAQHNNAKSHCTGNVCDAKGVSYRDSAMTAGDVSTITTIVGASALVGGVVLVLTAPKNPEKERVGKIRAVPHVALNGGGFVLEGVLP